MGLGVMPSSTETEQALIGAMLINPGCRPEVSLRVPKDAFYSEAHAQIYAAILESNGGDFLSVVNLLGRKGILDKVGGRDYVATMAMNTWTSVGVQNYSEEINLLYQQRMLITACNDVIQDIKDGAMAEDSIANLRANLRQIEANGGKTDTRDYVDVLKSVMDDIETRMESGDPSVGISSGYSAIDTRLMGFEPKTLTYIIGRPSMGKTALALNIADNMARLGDGLVLFFSLEMSAEALTRRMLSAESKIFLSRIRAGAFEQGQLGHVINAADRLYDRKIHIADHPKWKTIESMAALVEKIEGEKKLSAIFVDHIQLMRSNRKFNNRHLEISFISNELKSIAKAYDVPVLALSQLNRDATKGITGRPKLSHMKESGDLEQDADVVLAIYRQDRETELMEIDCLKGRDSGTWRERLNFNRFTQKITDWRDELNDKSEPI